jgi:hypothetical protein
MYTLGWHDQWCSSIDLRLAEQTAAKQKKALFSRSQQQFQQWQAVVTRG